MELHVLHVLDVSAGERGHRDAVASRVVGVGRPAVERADATGREDGRTRVDRVPVGFRVTDDAVDAPLGGDQLERGGVLAHLDSLVVVEMVQERPQDVRARRGVDVEDAVVGVGGLARVVERPVVALVEPHLEGVDEHVLDGVVGGFDEYIDGVGIGGAVAGVDDVPLEALGSPRVVEIPPCAQSVLAPSGFVAFVRRRTSAPSRAAASAAEQPAMPLPTTSTSAVSPSVVVSVPVFVSVMIRSRASDRARRPRVPSPRARPRSRCVRDP